MTKEMIYKRALAVDKAYSRALIRMYGEKEAGDARYDYKRNQATPTLRKIAALKMKCDNEWIKILIK